MGEKAQRMGGGGGGWGVGGEFKSVSVRMPCYMIDFQLSFCTSIHI